MISAITANNSHIKALIDVLPESRASIDCLIVAHSNGKLVQSLENAFADKSAVLLPVHQDRWGMEGNELPEAVLWAIEERGVHRIVLVGDSSAYCADRAAGLLGTSGSPPIGVGPLARARQMEKLRKRARDHFLAQRKALVAIPSVAAAIAEGGLVVNGLFYRAESGVFTIYNEPLDSFEILAARGPSLAE